MYGYAKFLRFDIQAQKNNLMNSLTIDKKKQLMQIFLNIFLFYFIKLNNILNKFVFPSLFMVFITFYFHVPKNNFMNV